jgi:nucleoside-diphosphate-sugar epimerase
MKILFTGSSSFTGCRFIQELAGAGHEVVAVFRRAADEYEGVRALRVSRATGVAEPVYRCSFGDERFLRLVRGGRFDLVCHHAAETTDYRSGRFDPVAALAANTCRLPDVLDAFARRGGHAVLLTGTVFEPDEGSGDRPLTAFSPYGLSKGLTDQTFRYYCGVAGVRPAKLVVPNPFGPLEDARFTSFLVRSWYQGAVPTVQTPDYVRDNIHVSLLARAYASFAGSLESGEGAARLAPSGYRTSQGGFAQLFAAELEPRLGLPCPLELLEQHGFPEPRVRVNADVLDPVALGWNEEEAWDELAEYYRLTFGSRRPHAA